MEIVGAIIAVVVGIVVWNKYRTSKRRRYLFDKYQDESIVDKIMGKMIWQGMSEDQLIDSWGIPVAKDNRVYKTKTAETFKYDQIGKNRFGSRVRVENGIVVGWDKNNN
ncbi:MAG: hypothetical protein WDN46_24965 [Methylocella sp.]